MDLLLRVISVFIATYIQILIQYVIMESIEGKELLNA